MGHVNNNKVFAVHYSVEVRLIVDEIETILRIAR